MATYTWATFKNAVKALLTDATLNDTTAIRAIATFVKAQLVRDLDGNLQLHEAYLADWMVQRTRLLGYTTSISGSTLRTQVNKLLTDAVQSEDSAVRAIAEYVKWKIASEVDRDPGLAEMYQKNWLIQRRRLVGYTVTGNTTTLRTEVNKLITVDAARKGIDDTGGFIDEQIEQAKADIGALNTMIDAYITHAVAEIAAPATKIDNHIRQGVIELQELIDFYRQHHETIYQENDLTDEGEASIGQMPEEGQLLEAYYVKVGEPCIRKPIQGYPWGNRHDLVCGQPKFRADDPFLMAIEPSGQTFYVFPPVLDGHYLSVFWDGLKLEFTDSESVPFDEGFVQAIADYVQSKRYLEPGNLNPRLAKEHEASYLKKRRALYRTARDRVRIRDTSVSPFPLSGCAIQEEDTDLVEFMVFGDSGEFSTIDNTIAVSELVKSLEPDFILHLGDANYPDGDPETFQANLIDHYSGWLTEGKWYQAWGNHDLEQAVDGVYGQTLLDVVPWIADLNEGKLYYKFTKGFANIFVLNSGYSDGDPRESDGITTAGDQYAWLEAELAAATTGFNIVAFHRGAYSSDVNNTPGSTALRWPFNTKGAHLVLQAHGHNYERGLVDGLSYVTVGLGGATKRGFGSVYPGSQFRYNNKYGAAKISVSETQLKLVFYSVDKEPIDQLIIKAED